MVPRKLPNTVAASLNETLCLRTFSAALPGSHSNSTPSGVTILREWSCPALTVSLGERRYPKETRNTRALIQTTREQFSVRPEVQVPTVPVGDARAMDDIGGASLSQPPALIGAFAAGALHLAAMSQFSVVSG